MSVDYIPESCGPHEIYADVTGGSNVRPAEQVALLDVGIDYHSAIGYLMRQVDGLAVQMPGPKDPEHKTHMSAKPNSDDGLPPGQIRVLEGELTRAEQALDADRTGKGTHELQKFADRIAKLEGEGRIDKEQVDALIAQVQQIIGCVQ